jgi:hypothetical protein
VKALAGETACLAASGKEGGERVLGRVVEHPLTIRIMASTAAVSIPRLVDLFILPHLPIQATNRQSMGGIGCVGFIIDKIGCSLRDLSHFCQIVSRFTHLQHCNAEDGHFRVVGRTSRWLGMYQGLRICGCGIPQMP